VTVRNVGKLTASIGQIVPPADFEIPNVNDLCSGKMIATKGKCTFDVQFAPPSPQPSPVAEMLAIPHDGTETDVALSGTALAVTLSAPKSETFPSTLPNKVSTAKTITISNTSPLAVTLKTGSITPGTNFQIVGGMDKCSGMMIGPSPAPSKKCTMQVDFAPGALPAGAVPPETLNYPFTYGASLPGNVAITLKGTVK
jgi:hypothetical protein